MTARFAYLSGLLIVWVAGGFAAAAAAGPERRAYLVTLAVTTCTQGPAGWLLVRAVGTSRLLATWIGGMALRVVLLGVFGLVLIPVLGLPPAATMIALALVLFSMLMVEVLVVIQGQNRTGDA